MTIKPTNPKTSKTIVSVLFVGHSELLIMVQRGVKKKKLVTQFFCTVKRKKDL